MNRARKSATFCWRRCSASAWLWRAVRRSARQCVSARAIAASWMHCCACRSLTSWPAPCLACCSRFVPPRCFYMAGAWLWKGAFHRVAGGDDGVSRAAAGAGAKSDGALHKSGFGRCLAVPGVGAVRYARRRVEAAMQLHRRGPRRDYGGGRCVFAYRRAVLSGLSFRVQPGTICAILGPSGTGKSTLADLLVRFHDPTEGSIRLDGRDLRELRPGRSPA